MRTALVSLSMCIAVWGCKAKYGEVDQTPEHPTEATPPGEESPFVLGPTVTCGAPTSGFDRLNSVAAQRGISGPVELDTSLKSCMALPGGLSARDLNGDGAPEVAFHQRNAFPWVYCNDGNGMLSPCMPGPEWSDDREMRAHGWVDLDGNELPDLIVAGLGFAAVALNVGDEQFLDFKIVWEQPDWPRSCIVTLAWGDLNGDGTIDLILPGSDSIPYDGSIPGTDHELSGADTHILLGDGTGQFTDAGVLEPHTSPTLSVFAAVTDRDMDGDQDILLASDRTTMGDFKTAFFRNDNGTFTDDAPAINADVAINGMGMGQLDLNQDGLPDYCITDVSPSLTCLMSDGDGGYYDAGMALGLFHAFEDNPILPEETTEAELIVLRSQWSPWSLEMTDLNNDSHPDAVTVAGVPPEGGSVFGGTVSEFQPDVIWQGTSDGFVERTFEMGFGNFGMNSRYGLATVDLDGDGYLEIVTAGHGVEPEIWNNPCGSNSWMQIAFNGPPGNTDGYGAIATVTANGTAHQQQLHGLRTAGQGPALLHFGLGLATEAQLDVMWPGGQRASTTVNELNRIVTVVHPEAR